jgi:large subunit ribosomal protein L29
MNKEKQEMRSLTPEQLTTRIEETRRELFSLRLQAATTPIQDYKKFRKLRKTIARLQTYLHQKRS